MIIRPSKSSLFLITQPDHAALARRVMDHWAEGGLQESARRDDILLAIREHDNGWAEVDAAPIVDGETGKLLDFVNAPREVRQGVWPRGIARLADAPFAAALVAQHALHIYGRKRHDREWADFFAQMERTRAQHLRRSGAGSLDVLQSSYAFLRMADLMSLAFCHGWRDARTDEFGYVVEIEPGALHVTPDPFRGARVPLEISARELPDRPFSSQAEALDAFGAAREIRLTGVAAGRAGRRQPVAETPRSLT